MRGTTEFVPLLEVGVEDIKRCGLEARSVWG